MDLLTSAAEGSPIAPFRWRLHRAGIINVYQYENETFHFGDGRLLLRGVNGSGKSTAMNMLLPFLFTARLGRIDAAGEQSGMLKSWMLNGRDDAQPVGYLWLELERDGDYLVCGCGIKANRQTDTVSTWWFITEKRPHLDLWLVERGVPLSADALRTALDGDEVYRHDRRRDYRAAIEHQLFGGASIDQHIGLINIVRSPRVGDRIDVDLPDHLVAALPQLSEQALAEAAQPLDDLEEHRRNVAELARTAAAVNGLLDVYRPYVVTELRLRSDEGRRSLDTLAALVRDEAKRRRQAEEAAATLVELDTAIAQLEADVARLRREISTLEESQAYRDGQQLEGLRDLVANLTAQRTTALARVERAVSRLSEAEERLTRAERQMERDLATLNDSLAELRLLSQRCQLVERSPDPVTRPGATVLTSDTEAGPAGVDRTLGTLQAAVRDRRTDVATVERLRSEVEQAENQLIASERARDAAEVAFDAARERLEEHRRQLFGTESRWIEQARSWARKLVEVAPGSFDATPWIVMFAGSDDRFEEGAIKESRLAQWHGRLLVDAEVLVDDGLRVLAGIESSLGEANAVADEARSRAQDLDARTEPDPPRLEWQLVAEVCLADLIDFSPLLGDDERAGLEGALAASGLLSARVVDGSTVALADGDLVVLGGEPVANPLAELLAVTVPEHLTGAIDPAMIQNVLASISHDPTGSSPAAVSTDGSFRLGTLHGRHRKARAEFIGVTARRAALERARAEAAEALQAAIDVVTDLDARRTEAASDLDARRQWRAAVPSLAEIDVAQARVDAAEEEVERAETASQTASEAVVEAERSSIAASSELRRVATTLALPLDSAGLNEVGRDLDDGDRLVDRSRSQVATLTRSTEAWREAGSQRESDNRDLGGEREGLQRIESDLEDQRTRLNTLEDSIGIDYREVIAARDAAKSDLDALEPRQPERRAERDAAVARRAACDAEVTMASQRRTSAEENCERLLVELGRVLSVRGLLDALDPSADGPPEVATTAAGSAGLSDLLDAVAGMIPADVIEPVTADGVRQSLRQRRDSLGAGWDAETWQPDPGLPLSVEVNGPSGKATLSASARAVARQHEQLASLLNRKQDDALRELLQGLIAREVAEKVFGANRLVELMNERLGMVSTAHDVGVRLRWRRSPELSPAMSRTVDLLATLPDLRTEDDERELRQSLSERLDEARRMHPDLPYRQLIADTLDYRQWHEMSVMLRRGGASETKLSARTPLSEGEKKLVTYLPLFAAVAASCDALAEQQRTPGSQAAGISRFVLLDDAFAKVSEDNHPALFGLLVDLDLDLIATSERLWGTHATVPEIAITEVVRDVDLGVILLEHYHWDGFALERRN